MSIPSMREIIKGFNACDPAVHWAGDMDVQTGYELCTEPGWLMLLLFRIQDQKNAQPIAQSIKTAFACIEPGLLYLRNEKVLKALATIAGQVLNNREADKDILKYSRLSLTEDIAALDASIRSSDEIVAADMAELYMFKAVDSIFGAILLNDTNRKVAGDGAHTAIDMVAKAMLVAKYPKYYASTMNKHGYLPDEQAKAKMYYLAKKIELCRILRSTTPQPFVSYE